MSDFDDRLTVVGLGSSRDKALEHADQQARQWFGEGVGYERQIGEAGPEAMLNDGSVVLFRVEVTYR